MKKASLFISLSKFEGSPNAVMEAMACGCPLVLSDIPGHREILNDKSALFVDPSNIRLTANAILKVLNNTYIKRNLSLIAMQEASHFTISKMVDKWEKVYLSLM
jgi:glycosyltransferase involved in cell wall biosynthesis